MTFTPTSSRTIVGIDLGTTSSLVSALRDGRPTVLCNALGESLTPSAVSATEQGELLIGAAALARESTHGSRTATTFKRDMGTNRTFDLGTGRTFTAPELSAMVLRSLREDAERALGHAVDEAVITVPAYFDEAQRRATRDAAAIAGLKVDRLINEPTAAALAYGLDQKGKELRATVLDLGGGTFDVTVLEIIEGVIEVQGSAGDTRLGGEDFVAALVDLVIKGSGRGEFASNPQLRARLWQACEHTKRRLSFADHADVVLGAEGAHPLLSHRVTRKQAEQAWAPLIERMRMPVLRALRDARVTPQTVGEVLLVGGATRMPFVVGFAARLFGREPLKTLPPDEAVALGAAVQAGLQARDAAVEDIIVTDVAPFTMGVDVSARQGRAIVNGLFQPIIERGSVIPVSRVDSFCTMADQQKQIDFSIYQGEHSLCRDNRLIGSLVVGPLPLRPAGKVAVDVRFTYDLNGLLEVEATVRETGKTVSTTIERVPGSLSAAEVATAREAMKRLKFHPREALPNATALARADAAYAELVGDPRDRLAEAIAAFRLTLEGQNPHEIELQRQQLVALLGSFRNTTG